MNFKIKFQILSVLILLSIFCSCNQILKKKEQPNTLTQFLPQIIQALPPALGTCDTSCTADSLICNTFKNNGSKGGIVKACDETTTSIKVIANGLPEHPIGDNFSNGSTSGYGYDPNTAKSQAYTFYIPTGKYTTDPSTITSKKNTSLGNMAVSYNGVPIYNPKDGREIDNCSGTAGVLEVGHTDSYMAHPERSGAYHYHQVSHLEKISTLQIANNSDGHSPLIGWSFDGYPIYGPMGYSDANSTSSSVIQLKSCYSLKTARTCCGTGKCTTTDTVELGKGNTVTLVLGSFVQDYEYNTTNYNAGTCHLTQYNMRYAKTPESPNTKIWFYVGTGDTSDDDPLSSPDAEFPYFIGETYSGFVDSRNLEMTQP